MVAFRWKFDNFPFNIAAQRDGGNAPLTSETFHDEGHRWRGVLTSDMNLSLQLLASAQPVTVEIRWDDKQIIKTICTLKVKQFVKQQLNKQEEKIINSIGYI